MSAPRQRNRFQILAGLVILGIVAGGYLVRRSQAVSLAKTRKQAEVADLEERFRGEKERFEKGDPIEPTAPGTKFFVLDDAGTVIAHPNASEVGTQMHGLAALLREGGEKGRVETRSWEGFPATVYFERLPAKGRTYVMERVHSPVRAGMGLGPFHYAGSIAAVILGIALLAGGIRGRSEIPVQDKTPAEPPRARLPNATVGDSPEKDTLESIARSTRRPAFFFRYDARQGIAILSVEAGYVSKGIPMSFAMPSTLTNRDLSAHAPLLRILRPIFGTAKIDAQAIVRGGPPYRGENILGVLVSARTGARPSPFPSAGVNLNS